MLKIKKLSLGNYNGKNGNQAFIAYKGKVYDVTDLFVNGEHNSCIAGNDLTDILELMPHGDQILDRFLIVADLED